MYVWTHVYYEIRNRFGHRKNDQGFDAALPQHMQRIQTSHCIMRHGNLTSSRLPALFVASGLFQSAAADGGSGFSSRRLSRVLYTKSYLEYGWLGRWISCGRYWSSCTAWASNHTMFSPGAVFWRRVTWPWWSVGATWLRRQRRTSLSRSSHRINGAYYLVS